MHPTAVPINRFRRLRQAWRRGESGSALIAVLSLVIAGSLLTIAVLAMSQYSTYTLAAHTAMQKSRYICEGVAERVQFLVSAERNQNPNVDMSTFRYSDYEYDRFLPDGVEHTMDYHGQVVRFTLTDPGGALDLTTAAGLRRTAQRLILNSASDTEYTDRITTLQNQITDYTDPDDSALSDSLEETEYQEENRAPLPRNAAMEYREELFYLPGFPDLFPPDKNGRLSAIRIIPPTALATIKESTGNPRNPTRTTTLFANSPNIFSAGDLYLKNACMLDDSELAQVKESLRLLRTERSAIADTLDSTLLGKLRTNMLTWTPGRAYTVIVDPRTPGDLDGTAGTPARRLAFSFTASDISGPSDYVVRCLEWMFF